MRVKECYRKFTDGESLSDVELKVLYVHMVDLSPMLFALGPEFRLAAIEVERVKEACAGYMSARAERRTG